MSYQSVQATIVNVRGVFSYLNMVQERVQMIAAEDNCTHFVGENSYVVGGNSYVSLDTEMIIPSLKLWYEIPSESHHHGAIFHIPHDF